MTTIQIKAKMPELPVSTPPIFALRVPKVNEKALLDLASTLRLKAREDAGQISRDGSTLAYSEGAFDLTIHRASGAFRFKDRNRWQVDDKSNVRLSDEAAAKLARGYLSRYRLLPEDSRVLRVSRLHVASAGPDRKIEDHRVIDVAVHFQPVVRGLPIDGPGGTVTVYLDSKGKMTCLDHVSRSIGPVYRKVTRLRPPEDVIEGARKLWTERGVKEVAIREVRLCYFEMGWDDVQRYLQPAYIVLATLFGPDRRIKSDEIHVTPAAVNYVAGLVPRPPPRRAAQKPRKGRGQ
jgi:hypothetical protein